MTIGKRIAVKMKELNLTEMSLAKMTGLTQPTIHRTITGEIRNPRFNSVQKIAKSLNVDIDWLWQGKEPKHNALSDPIVTDKNIITIPLYDIQASMGSGITPPSFLKLIRNITVEKDFFVVNNIKVTSFNNLVMVTGIGDSMLPTFNSGDPIIVDMGVTMFKEDGIYFFTLDNDLYFKRLQKIPKCLRMISDNTLYEAFDIRGEDLNDLIFHGKALFAWCGKRI